VTLRNVDYSDRELLMLLRDMADADGVCSADSLALGLGYDEDSAYRVAPRLSWMTRYGFLARVDGGWMITEDGEDIMVGKLSATTARELDEMGVGKRILALRALAQGYVRGGDVQAAAVRREWQHQAARRPR